MEDSVAEVAAELGDASPMVATLSQGAGELSARYRGACGRCALVRRQRHLSGRAQADGALLPGQRYLVQGTFRDVGFVRADLSQARDEHDHA